MAYAFVQQVPANAEIYAQIKEKLGDRPDGLIAHIAQVVDGGLRYTDVWESEAHWMAFRDEKLEPVVGEVLAGYGIPHTHDAVTFDRIEVIDTWVA